MVEISLSESRSVPDDQILDLYQANGWSAAQKPVQLTKALANAHSLVSAWSGDRLVGLGNAISDGHLVVYFPHLLVHPDFQGKGVGKKIMNRLLQKYASLHMQMLVADQASIEFYKKLGFEKAGNTQSKWIYQGKEH